MPLRLTRVPRTVFTSSTARTWTSRAAASGSVASGRSSRSTSASSPSHRRLMARDTGLE